MNRRNFLTHLSVVAAGVLVAPACRADDRSKSGAAGVGADSSRSRVAGGDGDDPKQFVGREQFDRLLNVARERNWAALPIGAMMGQIGLELRGTPYVASTLELYTDREVCSINLLGLDCVTFFENALAFARMLKAGESTPEAMLEQVRLTRYYNGEVGDYASRIHYTSDWLLQNEKKGVVEVVTDDLPHSQRFTKTINFMSTHPDAYRQLKANPELVEQIAKIEDRINAQKMYWIPKEHVASVEEHLETGDIIGVTTSIAGIGCSHTGLCYRDDDGKLRFLHASTTHKQVYLDDTLSNYLAGVTKHTGIMAARPVG